MDEQVTTSATEAPETSDEWVIDTSDITDDADDTATEAETEDSETAEAAEADQPEAEQAEETESPAEASTEPEKAEVDQSFKVKYLGEEKELTREEAVAFAQKGMDYDRQKAKVEELTTEKAKADEATSFLAELAKEQNLSVEDFIDNTKAQILANREGIDQKTALEKVKLQKEKAEIARQKAQLEATKSQQTAQDEAEAKRAADIKEFLGSYKDVDPKTIPQSVWDDVKNGLSLTSAYIRYEAAQVKAEVAKLKADLEAEKQAKANKEKSTGSRSTAGKSENLDPFLAGWNSV